MFILYGKMVYHRIANMDETPVFFDTVPSKTADIEERKESYNWV